MSTIAAIVVAAGRGTRVAGAGLPKQYIDIAGEVLLTRTLRPLLAHPSIARVLVVIHPGNEALYRSAIEPIEDPGRAKLLPPTLGGETRQQSVRRGLQALADRSPDLVLIHDAARPFVTKANLDALIGALEKTGAAILASPLADTLKRAAGGAMPVVEATVPRERLWRAETPQGFRYRNIARAHADALASDKTDFTDDASIAEWSGMKVTLVDSGGANTKITTAGDVAMAEQRFAAAGATETCVGQGFDVHRFTDGDHVWLCGVRIAHTRGVEAHSDGDVALHALTDAILGAVGDGDIGLHFKNTDPRWRGASSDQFLLDARRRVEARGGKIRHVDLTILAEAPKVGPHRAAMIERLSALLELPAHRIGLKATTTEGMGFAGRREGLAAMATATVVMPASL